MILRWIRTTIRIRVGIQQLKVYGWDIYCVQYQKRKKLGLRAMLGLVRIGLLIGSETKEVRLLHIAFLIG